MPVSHVSNMSPCVATEACGWCVLCLLLFLDAYVRVKFGEAPIGKTMCLTFGKCIGIFVFLFMVLFMFAGLGFLTL